MSLGEIMKPPLLSIVFGANAGWRTSFSASKVLLDFQLVLQRLFCAETEVLPEHLLLLEEILVLGVFPRRRNLDHPHRKQIIELNSYLPNLLKDIPNVTFLDIGEKFLDEKGFLSQEMMPDTTHPSEKGHEIWAAAIIPKLKEMMAQ